MLNDKSMRNLLHIPAGHSLALVNIHNRLRNHYGDRYGLDIQCPAEGGVCVTLLLPFLPVPGAPRDSRQNKEEKA